MYQMLKAIQQDSYSIEDCRKKLANYFKTEFLSGKDSDRSATYKALERKQVPSSKYAAYLECAKLNADSIKATTDEKLFKSGLHKASYILGILERYTAETIITKNDYDPSEMY